VFDVASPLSAIAGLVHGFTDRHGGVSTGRYASLNMASKWGDDLVAVAENRRRVAVAAGFDPAALRMRKQVHGAEVVHGVADEPSIEADALWCTRDDGVVVGVLTADCVPVLLADRDGTIAAAIHSGWRSTVAGVVGRTVAALRLRGVAPELLVAAIGPCIEQPAFEVGPEVAALFDADLVAAGPRRPHVDLVAAVTRQLVREGVPTHAIARVGGCTHAQADRWFSFRRDGADGPIGQMLAFVGYPGGAPTRVTPPASG
jgi:hypothetical protein